MDRPTGEEDWDVFISYSRSDADLLELLAPALRHRGLRVFVDDTAVEDFAGITSTISRALARSKVLLALYSHEYPRRRACQWELTYAFLAGQREGDPRRRILVINPEQSADHVQPLELRDARHWPGIRDKGVAERLADRVGSYVAGLTGPLGGIPRPTRPRWLPAPIPSGSRHFTGRLAEQWHLHTALHRHRAPLVSQRGHGRTAVVRGMPGIGKSLLAQEYALQFASSFPGGIYWFDLHAAADSPPQRTLESYFRQLEAVSSALGIEVRGKSLHALLSHLAVTLGQRDEPCLWVLDGVPDGLSREQLALLHSPHMLAATLLTTRSQHYGSSGEPLDLGPLPDADAYDLLTSRRLPADATEHLTADEVIRDLGGHPLALDLMAERMAHENLSGLRRLLHSNTTDVLLRWERAAAPGRTSDHTPRSSTLLPRSIKAHSSANDILRILALVHPASLADAPLQHTLALVDALRPSEAGQRVAEGIDVLIGDGVVRPSAPDARAWSVHPLIARAVRRHDEDVTRQEDLRQALLHTLVQSWPTPILESRTTPTTAQEHPVPSPSPVSPHDIERAVAFDLQVELSLRVGVQPLAEGQGSLREALASLHSLFTTARDCLHRLGPNASASRLPYLVATLVNDHLRPFLSTWHPALEVHEAARPAATSTIDHERRWEHASDMRNALSALREPLTEITSALGELSGADLLTAAAE
ncbi:TIR domain-containing protein [Streptomyces sp. S186]|uniref:toll/interleukin-1 receptor domain-containing protein n=1 Tax=Streptomyces sp. S186 TaxID=3434395 RepID=UPI003F66FE29